MDTEQQIIRPEIYKVKDALNLFGFYEYAKSVRSLNPNRKTGFKVPSNTDSTAISNRFRYMAKKYLKSENCFNCESYFNFIADGIKISVSDISFNRVNAPMIGIDRIDFLTSIKEIEISVRVSVSFDDSVDDFKPISGLNKELILRTLVAGNEDSDYRYEILDTMYDVFILDNKNNIFNKFKDLFLYRTSGFGVYGGYIFNLLENHDRGRFLNDNSIQVPVDPLFFRNDEILNDSMDRDYFVTIDTSFKKSKFRVNSARLVGYYSLSRNMYIPEQEEFTSGRNIHPKLLCILTAIYNMSAGFGPVNIDKLRRIDTDIGEHGLVRYLSSNDFWGFTNQNHIFNSNIYGRSEGFFKPNGFNKLLGDNIIISSLSNTKSNLFRITNGSYDEFVEQFFQHYIPPNRMIDSSYGFSNIILARKFEDDDGTIYSVPNKLDFYMDLNIKPGVNIFSPEKMANVSQHIVESLRDNIKIMIADCNSIEID